MVERETIDVTGPLGGWGPPWPNVAEIERVLPHEKWRLIGGLMAQLHCIHRGLDVIRPTNDIDIVLHVETTEGVAKEAADALESLAYRLETPVNPLDGAVHRFRRGSAVVDLLTSRSDSELLQQPAGVVDVLVAEHAAPRWFRSCVDGQWWRSRAEHRRFVEP